MGYLGNFFVSIDQLGNVLAGGNPDNTISSRVGFYTRHSDRSQIPWQWKFFEMIIDATFYPIDGPQHCHEAYHNDAGETFDPDTSNIIVSLLAFIIIPSCLAIALLLYTLWLFRLVSPREINRNANIQNRLRLAEAKLYGTLHELNEHRVEVDEALQHRLEETRDTLNEVSQKIEGMLNLEERLERFKDDKS